MTTNVTQPEPMPTPGETSVTRLVIADLLERERQGIIKYGTTLQTFNGRDPLVDAYQESIDKTQYLRQAVEEQKVYRKRLEAAEALVAAWQDRYHRLDAMHADVIGTQQQRIEALEQAVGLAIIHINGQAIMFSERDPIAVLQQLREALDPGKSGPK
jgi:hypothetical protein